MRRHLRPHPSLRRLVGARWLGARRLGAIGLGTLALFATGLTACESRIVSLLPQSSEPPGGMPPGSEPPRGSVDVPPPLPSDSASQVLDASVDPPLDAVDASVDAAIAPSTAPTPSVEPLDASVAPSAPASDAGSPDVGPPDAARLALLHRYEFTGTDAVVTDSVGNAHGEVLGGALLSDGVLSLDGVDDHVRLPPGMVSGLQSATFMIWATWRSDRCWERFFDFGSSTLVGDVLEADTTVFLTPLSCLPDTGPAFFMEFRGELEGQQFGHEYFFAVAAQPIGIDSRHQFTAVIDHVEFTLSLFVDGMIVASGSLLLGDTGVPFSLANVADQDNWLGRSQYAADAYLNAEIEEFRIYGEALTEDQIATASFLGPNILP